MVVGADAYKDLPPIKEGRFVVCVMFFVERVERMAILSVLNLMVLPLLFSLQRFAS